MKYLIRRLLLSIPLLFFITLISFVIMHLAPGDPTTIMMNPNITAEDMAIFKHNLGLDRPILVQYFFWLKELLTGNFGYSHVRSLPVLTAIGQRIGPTLILSLSSLILIIVITFPLGLISGYKKNSWFDNLVTVGSFIGFSIPTFWLGLMLILFFSLKLNLFPISGFRDPYLSSASIFNQVVSIMHHMFLPLITIMVGGIAGLTRYHRFGIIGILSQDYIKSARARGLSENRILYKHAFKNAALPLITILGMQLPGLIGGSFIIEYIFAWPGMGQLGVQAVFQRDYPIIMGTLFFSSILIILGNLLSDFMYSLVDPRISARLGKLGGK